MDAVTDRRQWDEALARLLAYFARLEIGGEEHRVKTALRILDEARAGAPDVPPVQRAMDAAAAALEQWFAGALSDSAVPPERRLAFGLVAWRTVRGAERWPDAVLAGPPPEELRRALGEVSLPLSPDLEFSSMISREMDYGAVETIAQETWHQFAWAPLLRAAAIWAVIFFGALYAWDRFFPQ